MITEPMCMTENTASSCWFSESLKRDLGRVTLVVVAVVVVAYNSFCYRSQHRRSKFAMALLIVYLVTVDASDKCKERRAWPTLNLSSASMLLAESVTSATEFFWRHVKATLQSNRNKRGLNTSCTIHWNVTMTVCFSWYLLRTKSRLHVIFNYANS